VWFIDRFGFQFGSPDFTKPVKPRFIAKSVKLTGVMGRLFRLARALSPGFARPDDTWAQSVLSKAEFGVYLNMDARDREHAVRVTKRLLVLYPDSSLMLQRATLLHDCGKSVRPYNVIERVLVGLLIDAQPSNARVLDFKAKRPSAAEVKKYHPQIGSSLILAAGGEVRVAEIVALHHAPGTDLDAQKVHEVDELE
jgi:HD domain